MKRRGLVALLGFAGTQLAVGSPAVAEPGLCDASPLTVQADPVFSPRNQDGHFDRARIEFDTSREGDLSFEVFKGTTVLAVRTVGAVPAGVRVTSWDGRTGERIADSGNYRIVGTLRSSGCLDATAETATRIDNRAPVFGALSAPDHVKLRSTPEEVAPFSVSWGALDEPATLRFTILNDAGRRLHAANQDLSGPGTFSWKARRSDGGLYAPGWYRWQLRAIDAVGNRRVMAPRAIALTYRPCGSGGPVRTFGVHADASLPILKPVFAARLFVILCEPKGWIRSEAIRWRYEPGGTTLVGLRTADATEDRCLNLVGLSVRRYFSCGTYAEVVLNADRWFGGSDFLTLSVARYRRLLVNHELGHAIGQRHRGCPGSGRRAPVMMQQSKGLDGCIANEYPTASERAAL